MGAWLATAPPSPPFFDRSATRITYDRFHGQRLLDRLGVAPAFPHGFGLSYTTFSIGEVVAGAPHETGVGLTATVRNTGDRDGRHVVQVYGRRTEGAYAGELMLVGFSGVDVPAHASKSVDVEVSFTPLAQWDPRGKRRVLPSAADVVLEVGSYAHDPAALVVHIQP